MDLEELFELIKEALGVSSVSENQETIEFDDREVIIDGLSGYLDAYNEVMSSVIENEKLSKIFKRVQYKRDPDGYILKIKKLPRQDKEYLFEQLSSFDFELNLDNFSEHFRISKSNVYKQTTHEDLLANLFFERLDSMFELLIPHVEESLEESYQLIKEKFYNVEKVRKLYNHLCDENILMEISEKEEKLIAELEIFTDEGMELFRRFVKNNNEQYMKIKEQERLEQERIKQQNLQEIYRRINERLVKEQEVAQESVSRDLNDQTEILDLDDVKTEEETTQKIVDENVDAYVKAIFAYQDLNTMDSIFPPKNMKNYHRVMSHVMTRLKETMNLYQQEIEKEMNPEMKNYLYDELELNRKKLDALAAYYQVKEDKIQTPIEEPVHLFFATRNGKVLVLEDLDSVDYQDLNNRKDTLTIINRLKLNNFTGSKKLQNNQKLDAFEMKLYQSRLIFERLCGNNYYVTQALIKKDDNDAYYRERIIHRLASTNAEYEQLKNKLLLGQIPVEYVQMEQDILSQIETTLFPSNEKQR